MLTHNSEQYGPVVSSPRHSAFPPYRNGSLPFGRREESFDQRNPLAKGEFFKMSAAQNGPSLESKYENNVNAEGKDLKIVIDLNSGSADFQSQQVRLLNGSNFPRYQNPLVQERI